MSRPEAGFQKKSAADPRGAGALGAGRRRAVLVVMCLALAVVVGMMTSLMVAVPDMARDLGAGESDLQWVVNAYGVVFAGLLLPGGALGDRYGRKGVLLAGLLIFGLASAGTAVVDDVGWVILLRAVAGVGAALVMPMTLSIITHVFPPEDRGRAIGVWSGVTVGGAMGAVLISGGLLEMYTWRSVFVVNVVLAAAALIGVLVAAPASKDSGAAPLDIGGGLLSVLGVGALVFAIVEGPERGWTSAPVWIAFLLGVAGLIAFVPWELRRRHPLLDPRMFRHRGLSAGALVITAEALAMFGFFFLGLQYLQEILGYSPLKAGFAIMPLAVGAMLFSPSAPKVARRFGMRPVVGLGMALIAAGLAIMAVLDSGSGYLPVLCGALLMGSGIAFAATPATEAIVTALPPGKQGVASALNDITRELGGVLGIAILGSVFNSTYRREAADAAEGLPAPSSEAIRDSLVSALRIAGDLGGARGAELAEGARSAFTSGMADAVLGGFAVVVLGGAAAVWLMPRRARKPKTGADTAD
ncbi:DHA2 family efflux MFS transporter permease subunit [Streptomyces sp. NPDC051018]|uniref:DHA2 family efflux MFS transporter permease subunit n=1 Tax=Streptomyces sp. NPDC051018 TaxID=3365639 RepID=UPI003797BEB3